MADGGGPRAATAIVLFTDVVGSTQLRQRVGDDRADLLRREHDRLLKEAVHSHGGVEVKGTGDGLMAVFDAAAEAVSAGVAMQQAVHRYRRRSDVDIPIRVGISAGDVSWEGNDCFGTPVVEASRLCAAADGTQVLVSEIVRLLAGSRGGHSFLRIGAMQLKGLDEPLTVYEVAWAPVEASVIALPLPLDAAESMPFVGRVGARETLGRAWKEAIAEHRRVVLISGEPGVGKTRLAAETARKAHADGATVLFGRCDEELGVAYQPFAEALSGFVERCPRSELADHLGPYSGDLVRLVPDLASRATALSEPLRAEPETERYRLFEAVDAFLAVSSALAPIVVVLDDIHWAEQATLLLLRHLVRSSRPARVLVIGTYRDTDLGRGHPLAEMLADFRREPNVERLDLHGLDEGEVTAFVEAAAGHALDEAGGALAKQLYTETEGNPFFVGQVLRNLAESGALVQRDGRWVAASGASLRLPEGVREVIGRRLSRLPESAVQTLEAAAVIGREFDDRLVVAAVDAPSEDVFDAFERAEEAHLIESVRGVTGRHAFVHALVRSTLYEGLATTRRLRLHRRVGEALEARTHDESVLPELARHFAEAAGLGEESKAASYGLAAARAARCRLAYEESARLCEQALAALDPGDPAASEAMAELLLELELAYAAAGDLVHTVEVAGQAADFARRVRRSDILAKAALASNGSRTWADAGVVNEGLVALLDEAIEALGSDHPALRARCLARQASELYFDQDAAGRREALISEAEVTARQIGDPDVLGYVLANAQFVEWGVGNADERLARSLEIVRLAEVTGNRELLANNGGWIIGAYLQLMRRDDYDAAIEKYTALGQELRMPLYEWWLLIARATQALMDGRFDDAQQLADRGVTVGQQFPSSMQMYGVALLGLRRSIGGLEELEPLTAGMVEQFPLVPAWRTGLALLYEELGRFDDAREQLEILAPNRFAILPRDANWLVGVTLLALVAEAVGDAVNGAVLYDLLLPYADLAVLAGSPADCLGSTSLYLALAAAASGQWDAFDRHAEDARRHHEQLRSPRLLGMAAFYLARAVARRGDSGAGGAALRFLDECLAHAEPIGMTRIVDLAVELRRLLRAASTS